METATLYTQAQVSSVLVDILLLFMGMFGLKSLQFAVWRL